MRRLWYVVALALLVAGLYGLHFVSPITPMSDPEALEVRFPGSYLAPGAGYNVTKRPAVGPAIGLGVAGGVTVLAAVALAIVTFARRRRRSTESR